MASNLRNPAPMPGCNVGVEGHCRRSSCVYCRLLSVSRRKRSKTLFIVLRSKPIPFSTSLCHFSVSNALFLMTMEVHTLKDTYVDLGNAYRGLLLWFEGVRQGLLGFAIVDLWHVGTNDGGITHSRVFRTGPNATWLELVSAAAVVLRSSFKAGQYICQLENTKCGTIFSNAFLKGFDFHVEASIHNSLTQFTS